MQALVFVLRHRLTTLRNADKVGSATSEREKNSLRSPRKAESKEEEKKKKNCKGEAEVSATRKLSLRERRQKKGLIKNILFDLFFYKFIQSDLRK